MQVPISEKPTDMERMALKSQHEGHDPTDPRTVLVEDLASHMCGYCAAGEHRWRDREDDGIWCHQEPFGYDANECECSSLLNAAIEAGVPIYTGAELHFDVDEDA